MTIKGPLHQNGLKVLKGLPNIFQTRKKSENDEKPGNWENVFYDRIMPDFRKKVFAATWRGGESRQEKKD